LGQITILDHNPAAMDGSHGSKDWETVLGRQRNELYRQLL
jgi:hypothetical protein